MMYVNTYILVIVNFPSKPTQSPPIQTLFKLGSVKAGSKETSNLINPFLSRSIENTSYILVPVYLLFYSTISFGFALSNYKLSA